MTTPEAEAVEAQGWRPDLLVERMFQAMPAHSNVTRRQLADALAAAWSPIESAPRDGTVILVPLRRFDGRVDVVTTHWSLSGWAGADKPTHWQPLPAPPKEADRE